MEHLFILSPILFYRNVFLIIMLLFYIIFLIIGETISASLNKFEKLDCLEQGLFSCYNDGPNLSHCIDKSYVCDGVLDCINGKDELDCSNKFTCPKHKFYCNITKICISDIHRCDGVKDCAKGEDEWDCDFYKNFKNFSLTTQNIFNFVETSTKQAADNKNTEVPIRVENIVAQIDHINTVKNEGVGLVGLISGIVGGILTVTLIAGLLIFLKYKKTKRKRNEDAARVKLLLSHGFPQLLEKDFKFYKTSRGQKVVLGRGNFGVVYKGKIWDRDVAIKELLINSAENNDIFSFNPKDLMEANMHNQVGEHRNIVKFFGVHISSEKKTFYMFNEFCPGGDLLSFLLKHYTNAKTENVTQVQIAQKDFLVWSSQILAGMAHLEQKKIVHGDLAARNVLLVSKEFVKIADFGLALQIRHDKNYIRRFSEKIPWQWMPFEVILELRYTTKSDVWSFGVLLWEMFSFGQMPFENLEMSKGMDLLRAGSRLEKPIFTPSNIYNVMESCWKENSEDRPKFEDLVIIIREISVDFLIKTNKAPTYL